MQISFVSDRSRPAAADQVCLFCQGTAAWFELADPLREHLEQRLRQEWVVMIPSLGHLPQPWVLGIALPGPDRVQLRRCGGAVARSLLAQSCHRAFLGPTDLSAPDLQVFLAGMAQGAYRFDRYRKKAAPQLQLRCLRQGLNRGQQQQVQALISATWAARDMINTPAMDCGPGDVVRMARRLCRGSGLRLRVLNQAALQRAGCACIQAVGAAAGPGREPRMLIVEWPGKGRTQKPIAICGKGVCFDSGGLQIKPGKAMELMRKDMGGAATALAALLVHAASGSQQAVRAYLPLVENAIDGRAFRPGDILHAADGTSIEVGHTDAEGRLVLADAIVLARREGAQALISVATLTGAALVALGRIHVPIIATHDAWFDRLHAAATAAGEKIWRLPLDADHRAMLRGKNAEISNSTGPEAACITAAAFLAHFAGDTPLVHADISPSSWRESAHDLGPSGATGILIDSLSRFLSEKGGEGGR